MKNPNSKIFEACRRVKELKAPNRLKERLALVLSKTKRNLTTGLEDKLALTDRACKKLGLHYYVIKKPDYPFPKLILGTSKQEVEELARLDKDIFASKNRKPVLDNRYSRLLGYPSCCYFSNIKFSGEGKVRNIIGFHLVSQNPWPRETSFGARLIYHIPCGPHCRKTINFARKHLLIRNLVFGGQTHTAYFPEKSFTLHFAQNLYSSFEAVESRGWLRIERIIETFLKPHMEGGDLGVDFSRQSRFLSKLRKGDKLKVDKDKVRLKKKKGFYLYNKEDVADGCLIKFIL